MARVRVPVHRTSPTQSVLIDPAATVGAQIGVNLLLPDGTVGTLAQLSKLFGSTATAGTGTITTTDDLQEGQWNLWFKDRRAQDAVGAILANSANVTLAYVGGTSITANLTPIIFGSMGSLYAFTFDTYGRVVDYRTPSTTDLAEGTNLYFTASRVLAAVLTGLSLVTSAVISAADTVLSALGKLQAQITDNLLPKGYIDGLKMVWVSGTALTVTSGAAYIPSLGKVLRATADIAKTSLSLTASTWYHIYLYSNAGTPDIEISTTAPTPPYSGTARTKTGDASKRYVGSVKTDSGTVIYNFEHDGNQILYREDIATGSLPFRVLSSGTATTDTVVSCAAVVPPTANSAILRMQNAASSGGFRVKQSNGSYATLGAASQTVSPGGLGIFALALNSNQELIYFYNITPTGGSGFIDVSGYTYDR